MHEAIQAIPASRQTPDFGSLGMGMDTHEASGRHVGWDHIAELLATGAPSRTLIPGSPDCEIRINEDGQTIALRIPVATDFKPAPLLERELLLRKTQNKGEWNLELSTRNPNLFNEFYTFACLVADRVQIDGSEPLRAIDETRNAWTDLLRPRVRLSSDTEVGLIGELWFLLHMADQTCGATAIECWKGAESGEHDFGLPKIDVEVKTTVGESRRHMISSLTQMVPSPGRGLLLLSVQITAASADQEDVLGLAPLIDQSRAMAVAAGPEAVQRLETLLTELNWRDEDRDLYPRRFRLRSVPTLVPVDDRFPGLVPDLLCGLGDLRNRILQVSYRVDVTGLGSDLHSRAGADLLEAP